MISAVSRTLAVLEALSNEANGVTVSELVMRLRIEKSIVSRLLATLQNDGYVIRDEATDSFRLGLCFAAIALRHIDNLGISDLCQPVLRGLANKTGELIQLAIVQNEQMIYVAKAEGQQRIRVLSLVGRTAVLHASSAGKVWLASLPENQAFGLALRQGLTRYTDKTISNIDQLRTELHRARKNGYALVEEEMFQGASAVAAPIFDRQHTRVLGAIILSGPTYRLPKKRMLSFVACLKEAADKLTELGNIDVHFGGAVDNEPVAGEADARKVASL